MPFSEWARAEMLSIWCDGPVRLTLGPESGPIGESVEVKFLADAPRGISNIEEIVFPRVQAETKLTHWYVHVTDTAIASDKLERPVILSAGERATFPVGALRLTLE